MLPDVSVFVIIPVHNRLEFTRACLSALSEQSLRDFTIVVVDDGSTDGTRGVLAKEFPAVRILSGDGSLWWTGAMNVGVGWVLPRAQAEDVVISLNNDTLPPVGYLTRLLRAHVVAADALIGSVLVDAEDRRTIIDGGVRVNWTTAKYHTAGRGTTLQIRGAEEPMLKPVDVLSGCGTLIPVRALRHAGPYRQERLRQYAADYEFSRRARRAGFQLLVDWNSPLYVYGAETGIHAHVATSGPRGLLRSFWSVRSANDFPTRLAFALAACPRWALPLYVPLDYIRVVFGSIRRYLSGSSRAAARD